MQIEYRLSLVTAPDIEPVNADDVKKHAVIEFDDDDTLLDGYIETAREQVENDGNVAVMTQTWDMKFDRFPIAKEIQIPKPPLQDVTSIKYLDTDGNEQIFSNTLYTVDTSGEMGRVYLNYNESWPTARYMDNAITIRFVAGYATKAQVNASMKQCIYLLVASMYKNRENETPRFVQYDNTAYRNLLSTFKRRLL